MDALKITIIGGGSLNWSPTIVRDIVVRPALSGSTICLHDINPEPLKLIQRLSRKIVRSAGAKFKIEATTRLTEALDGADFIILTISTGGLEAMRHDLQIPYKYGIYQPVGDTVGPGGISRALRNIPVLVDIARKMERYCRDAWFINYSNPLTVLTRCIYKTSGVKALGLCHELFGGYRFLQRIFGLKGEEEIETTVGGINHLPWILELKIRGEDGFSMLRNYIRKNGTKASAVKLELFKVFGALPASGDRHIAEFFPYFLSDEALRGAKYGVKLTTIEDRYGWLDGYRQRVMDLLSGTRPIDLKPSRETAARIIEALSGGEPFVDVVNLPNKGQIPNLPLEAVVETMGFFSQSGVRPITTGPLPPGILSIVHSHAIRQEMTVEAALTGDRKMALEVMATDPLVREFHIAKPMLDELIRAGAKYLPQFVGKRKAKRKRL